MDEAITRDIARYSHDDQVTRHGSPMSEHVKRVAASVPDHARAVAFLHDVVEKTDTHLDDLHRRGLTPVERAALELLTRREGETFVRHTVRIGGDDGPAGAIARSVKLADVEDHIGLSRGGGFSPYTGRADTFIASQHGRHETWGDTPVNSAVRPPAEPVGY